MRLYSWLSVTQTAVTPDEWVAVQVRILIEY